MTPLTIRKVMTVNDVVAAYDEIAMLIGIHEYKYTDVSNIFKFQPSYPF